MHPPDSASAHWCEEPQLVDVNDAHLVSEAETPSIKKLIL